MPLKFPSTFHSSVWTENFQMFNAHNSLSQPVHLSTTVHARYPFCSLLQSFDRSSLLRILRLLKGLRLDWFLAILFKAEVQLFRLRLRRTGWRKVARRYLAFTSFFFCFFFCFFVCFHFILLLSLTCDAHLFQHSLLHCTTEEAQRSGCRFYCYQPTKLPAISMFLPSHMGFQS